MWDRRILKIEILEQGGVLNFVIKNVRRISIVCTVNFGENVSTLSTKLDMFLREYVLQKLLWECYERLICMKCTKYASRNVYDSFIGTLLK